MAEAGRTSPAVTNQYYRFPCIGIAQRGIRRIGRLLRGQFGRHQDFDHAGPVAARRQPGPKRPFGLKSQASR